MKITTLVSPMLLLGVLGLVGCGCSKKEPPTATVPTAEPAKLAEAPKPAEPEPAGFGTIEGSVAFSGTAPEMGMLDRNADPVCAKVPMKDEEVIVNANKTLKNALVRVTTVTKDHDPPAEEATLTQRDCMYRPRVSGVLAGQTVAIKNGDKTLHNVHTYRGERTLFNRAQPPAGADLRQPFKKGDPNIVKFKCDVHPWMTAYLLVSNHPFFGVTGDDGKFTLEKVPAGKHTVEVWHEKYGTQSVEITVEPDKSATAEFSYDGTESE